jgi:hypothetical protein
MKRGYNFSYVLRVFILHRLKLQYGESKMSVEEAIFTCSYTFALFSLAVRSGTQLNGFVQIFKSLNRHTRLNFNVSYHMYIILLYIKNQLKEPKHVG